MAYNARPHRGLNRFRDQHGNWTHPSPDQVWRAAEAAGWAAGGFAFGAALPVAGVPSVVW